LLLTALLLWTWIEKRPRLLQTRCAAIDRYRMSAGPTAANPPHAAAGVDRWDRQTDGRVAVSRTLLRITMRAVSVTIYRQRKYTVRQKKRNHFSFMSKSFNMQCILTKFSTLIVNEYYHRFTYLISGMYTNFRRLMCKKCDVGYYAINHGVMKLMITG